MLSQEIYESSLLQRIAAQCDASTSVAEKQPRVSENLLWSLPGFGVGARVATSFGQVPVEALRRRDPVKTRDGRFLKVRHVDVVQLDRRFLLTHPDAQPIAIPRNGLGIDIPNQATLVSGRQKIRSPGQFNQAPGRSAEDYIGHGHIARKFCGYFTYYLFHCGEPCTVHVNGMWIDLDPDMMSATQD